MSRLDKNYKKIVNETIREFAERHVTLKDIFNYRSSMTKVSGFSEIIMPMSAGDQAPITNEGEEL